jgi:uncharacterized protein YndB with AHSA1/START domain
MAHIERGVFINTPIEKVFDFMAEPNTMLMWVHNLVEVKERSEGAVGLGTTYREAMKGPGGIKMWSITRISKYERPNRLDFESTSAGMRLTFAHRLEPKDNGTLVTEIGDYTLPGKFLGKVTDKLFMEKYVTVNVERTVEKLKAVMESGQAGTSL